MVKEAMLYKKLEADQVQCFLCSHRCKISPSERGICRVRENREGKLVTLVYGEVIACNVDPIEKKPLYHFLPGSTAYSIATAGCNFKCGFCQNWQISQVPDRNFESLGGYRLSPEEIVKQAKASGCRSISYTYTEPTIFFEYAYDTAQLARKEGLYNNFVTNGFMTDQTLEKISSCLDAANVDLKSFNEDFYARICKGRLQPVLDSIKRMKELNIWVEITTLLIPGQNDSEEELNKIACFIAGLGKEIPWHISRFHPDYRFLDYRPTPVKSLQRAYEIGKEAGLRYVYLGNVMEGQNTFCYNCGKLLVGREFFSSGQINIKEGKCVYCGVEIDGFFAQD